MGNCQPGQEDGSASDVPVSKSVLDAAEKSAKRRESQNSDMAASVKGVKPPPIPNSSGGQDANAPDLQRPSVFRSSSSTTYSFDPTLKFIKKRKYYKMQLDTKHCFVVDVRYQNLKRIGSGAYGVVCSAVDTATKSKVAIKKVSDVFADLVDAKRILREIRILTHLSNHKNIVGLKDVMVGPTPVADFKDLYLVFELFDGDLDRAVGLPQLTAAHIQYFMYQILRGMLYVHSAGIIHRDLKPPNILINTNNDLSVCDFGLARGIGDPAAEGEEEEEEDAAGGQQVMTEYVVTRWYRAPELLCGNSHYDDKIDVWSMGLIFAELLIGKTVLRGRNYFDQLRKSMALVGKPVGAGLGFVESSAARRAIEKMDFPPVGKLADIFSGYHVLAVDLLKKMLTFDPRERINVQQALEHPYFAKLRSEMDVLEEPKCDAVFDTSFERGYQLDNEMPKQKMQYFFLEAVQQVMNTQGL